MSAEQKAKIAAANTRPEPTEKRCPRCEQTKPASAFGRRSNNPRWLKSACRACEASAQKNAWRKRTPEEQREHNRIGGFRRRGTTEEEFNRMFAEQEGRCALCSAEAPPSKRLAVDHCHATGVVRGLLCDRCNTALGLLKDDPELLRRAAAYLDEAASRADGRCDGSGRRSSGTPRSSRP